MGHQMPIAENRARRRAARDCSAAALACITALLAACRSTAPSPATVPIRPVCTILCETTATSTAAWNGQVFVSERTDPNVGHNFSAFRPMSGPLGNPAIGFTNATTRVPDTYGISEAWLRKPGAPEVHRAQATPASRTGAAGPDNFGSGWNVTAQNASGGWSGVLGTGTANRGNEPDPPDVGAVTVPRFMPVGLANLQMFACAGGRAQDNSDRTTWLIESIAPNAAAGVAGSVTFIQDLLNGDDRFVPNAPGPLVGPPAPPAPSVSGPGHPIRNGSVMCAMTQLDDDVSTRELHMLAIDHGVLYHSMASDFGPVTSPGVGVFSRFRTVSPWGDVGQALGGGFGTITSAAIVAQPRAVDVFFIAESGGRTRLWHAVRFSAGGGSWRPPKDVLALSGDAPTGSVYSYKVSAGICPEFGAAVWDAASTELLVALKGGSNPQEVLVIRVVSTPRQWRAGVNGLYSPWQSLPGIPSDRLNNPFILRNVVITARPFRDNSTPASP